MMNRQQQQKQQKQHPPKTYQEATAGATAAPSPHAEADRAT